MRYPGFTDGASVGYLGNSPIRGDWDCITALYPGFSDFIEIYRNSPQKPPIGISIFSATCPPFSPFSGIGGDNPGIWGFTLFRGF